MLRSWGLSNRMEYWKHRIVVVSILNINWRIYATTKVLNVGPSSQHSKHYHNKPRSALNQQNSWPGFIWWRPQMVSSVRPQNWRVLENATLLRWPQNPMRIPPDPLPPEAIGHQLMNQLRLKVGLRHQQIASEIRWKSNGMYLLYLL